MMALFKKIIVASRTGCSQLIRAGNTHLAPITNRANVASTSRSMQQSIRNLSLAPSTSTSEQANQANRHNIYNHLKNIMSKESMKQPHIIHIRSTKNNTLITLTRSNGNILGWASAGTVGLKKSNRGTSDAGYQAVLQLSEKMEKKNVAFDDGVEVKFNGFGPGREMAFRAVRALGWPITRLTDITPIRHGGCRPKRPRRL